MDSNDSDPTSRSRSDDGCEELQGSFKALCLVLLVGSNYFLLSCRVPGRRMCRCETGCVWSSGVWSDGLWVNQVDPGEDQDQGLTAAASLVKVLMLWLICVISKRALSSWSVLDHRQE